ncbi:MAG: AMP-binding protein, partial [Alphaproteobacteria bacterium]
MNAADAVGARVAADTFPKLLDAAMDRRAGRPAFREKRLGIWQTWTWREWRADVHAIAAGLHGLGLRRGQTLAIIGDNRPLLYGAICAAQCLGAIPVPVYQDAVAEAQAQGDTLLASGARAPALERIVYDDPRGLRDLARDEVRVARERGAAGLHQRL